VNRITVIFLAVAILLAHTLAIHQTGEGEFAPPYDFAHAAYRMGRNLARAGTAAWNPGEALGQSYPSPIWVLLNAVFERVYIAPTLFSQSVGIFSSLFTVVVVAQLSAKRMSGLIAPILLAVSGSVAAAGAGGTETATVMLLLSASFLAFEWRWKRSLALSLAALALVRSDGAMMIPLLAALELFDRPRDGNGVRRRSVLRAFWVPALTLVLVAVARRMWTGSWLSPFERDLLDLDRERILVGGHYVGSYFLCSGVGALLPLPLLFLFLRMLSGLGRRALLLFSGWTAMVVLSGGSGLPFWHELVPALPLFFLAVQEAITGVIDRWRKLAGPAWTILVAVSATSLMVSKTPTDIGPLRIGAWHRAWLEPDGVLEAAYGRSHGRLGLAEEIRKVERLRALGVFLRDRIREPDRVLALWPGSIGYLSRKRVYDVRGRASHPSDEPLQSWSGPSRVDLVGELEQDIEYVVLLVGTLQEGAGPGELLHLWLRRFDVVGDTPERALDLLAALARYQLIAVPVPESSREPNIPSERPFLLLRNRTMHQEPLLELERDGRDFEVRISHRAHQQIADLTVRLTDEEGRVWSMRPTGAFVERDVCARAGLLLYASGSRPILALRATLPEQFTKGRLSAQLHNPGTQPDVPLAMIGSEVSIDVGGD